jgi:hypothetical protein
MWSPGVKVGLSITKQDPRQTRTPSYKPSGKGSVTENVG